MDFEVSKEIRERVEYLRKELTYHAQRYYVYDSPEISDYEYDMMYAELKRLEEENPSLYDPSSPTQRVGGKALDKFDTRDLQEIPPLRNSLRNLSYTAPLL